MQRAEVELAEISKFMFDLYGLTSTEIKRLNGYDDKNFHVLVNKNIDSNPNIQTTSNEGYVLKIVNTLDSQNGDKCDALNDLLILLNKNNILCPNLIANKKGKPYEKIILSSGVHLLCLLNYIEGTILHNVSKSPDLFSQVGVLAGSIINALKSFDHPVYHSKIQWSLGSARDVLESLSVISVEEKRELIGSIISEFTTRVLSIESELEQGIIHGDLNEQNIIVDPETLKIKAVIDFGDTHYGCYLYELALAIAYMIFTSHDIHAGRYVLNGYSTVRTVTEKEFKLLKICVLARYCQSLVYGAYAHSQDPSNEYTFITSKGGWELLKKMHDVPENDLLRIWGIDLGLFTVDTVVCLTTCLTMKISSISVGLL